MVFYAHNSFIQKKKNYSKKNFSATEISEWNKAFTAGFTWRALNK